MFLICIVQYTLVPHHTAFFYLIDPLHKDVTSVLAYMDTLEGDARAKKNGPFSTSILRNQLVGRQDAIGGDTRGLFSPKPFSVKQLHSIVIEQVSALPGYPQLWRGVGGRETEEGGRERRERERQKRDRRETEERERERQKRDRRERERERDRKEIGKREIGKREIARKCVCVRAVALLYAAYSDPFSVGISVHPHSF